jgi:hypothetical protein
MAHGLSYVTRPLREARSESRSAGACSTFLQLMVLAVVLAGGVCVALAQAEEAEYEPDVILVIKEKAFHMVKGKSAGENSLHPAFSLSAGEDIILELRNEDSLPHEFVSPLFAKVEFQFWGKATLVYTYTANGLRIDPGERVALRFELPKDFSGELFKFWCNVHGKLHGDVLQGEMFIVKPKHG